MYPIMDANERAQVEIVFGLTGGELEDRPLRFLGDTRWSDGTPRGEPRRWWRRWWYTGVPDYAQEIERRLGGEFLTIVSDELLGKLLTRILARGKIWRKVARYGHSGEAACYMEGEINTENKTCSICGENPGKRHGYVYLGDGWSETVYRAR